eukprot:12988_1
MKTVEDSDASQGGHSLPRQASNTDSPWPQDELNSRSKNEYFSAYKIDELFSDLREDLDNHRPKDPLLFLRNVLIHKEAQARDINARKVSEQLSVTQYSDKIVLDVHGDNKEIRRSSSFSVMSNHLKEAHEKPISPRHKIRHLSLSHMPLIGMDIGGTLCKICIFEPKSNVQISNRRKFDFIHQGTTYGSTGERDMNLSFECADGVFHFISFQTRRMEGALQMLSENKLFENDEVILATGGGAYKFSDMARDRLGVTLAKGDELSCLLKGLNFLLKHIPDECYYFDSMNSPDDSQTSTAYDMQSDCFPYLLVNIGSGVSILRIDDENSFERVSGTCIGGGTYWGLCKLLTKCADFDEAVASAEVGDSSKVDMLVSDIYGGDYDRFALKGNVVASAFGKIVMMNDDTFRSELSNGDITRSLVNMIGINVAQLAYLCAMRYKVTRVLFAGNFLRRNPLIKNAIAYSLHYWSQGVMKAFFLRHEGYFGAVGAYLLPHRSEDLNES